MSQQKQVTVSFFSLHVLNTETARKRDLSEPATPKINLSSKSLQVAGADWQKRLAAVAHTKPSEPADQTVKSIIRTGRTIDGRVGKYSGKYALSLSIDRVVPPRERNLSTGERKGMVGSGQGWDPAEETVAVFFERNIFGILSSNLGAPNHSDVAKWLSKFSPPYSGSDTGWRAMPITRPDILNQLIKQHSLTINAAEFTLRPANMDPEEMSLFGLISSDLNQQKGMEVKVKFSAGRTKYKNDNADEISDWVDQVVAAPAFQDGNKIVHGKVRAKGATGESKIYDLFSDRITERLTIQWDDQGADGKNDFAGSAVTAINTAFKGLEDVLLTSVPDVSTD